MYYRTRFIRLIAVALLLSFTAEIVSPVMALALTSGPSQPEYTGGSGGDLVNPFTGAFSYSIPVLSVPGPNGVGYGITLGYNNNTSVENESSWVGLGWSLNAGAINRVKRGYPDDYKGDDVIYWRNARDNTTTSVSLRVGLEAISRELFDLNNSVSGTYTLQYNNHTGYDHFLNLTRSFYGANYSLTFDQNGIASGEIDFKPQQILAGFLYNTIGYQKKDFLGWFLSYTKATMGAQPGSKYLLKSYLGSNQFHSPTRVVPYSGFMWSLGGGVQGDLLPDLGIEGGITGASTTISSVPKVTEKAFGYLYSGAAGSSSDAMDYYNDKEDSYSDKDSYLPLPFSNADYFSVSGAGIGGGFRAYHRTQGHFRPAYVKSKTDIFHLNLDIHLGGGIGIGAAAGGGTHSLQSEGWEANGLSFANDPGDGEANFFRFNGDRGGAIQEMGAVGDAPVQFDEEDDGMPNWYGSGWVSTFINDGHRVGRATYIGYNSNSDMLRRPGFDCNGGKSGVFYRTFSQRANIRQNYIERDNPNVSDGIGEFSITRDDGMTYVYGLPVYNRGEVDMSYGLFGLSEQNIYNNFLGYKTVAPLRETSANPAGLFNDQFAHNENLNGIEYPTPYASTFLLTEIVSPDFIDRTNNGPTPDDIGGYVIFNYRPLTADPLWDKSNKDSIDFWYKWRMPYRGLSYRRNSLSDPYDDAGTFSYGYKEVYYLESIETKTHKAVFYTSPRKDGYEATAAESVASGSSTATSVDPGPQSNPEKHQKLEKLDRIELWAMDPDGEVSKLLSTTFFEYDYSLCQGLPNAENNGGKLTLKKLWFEYEGAVNARISPYEFGYEYKQTGDYPSVIQTRYSSIVGHGDDFLDGQNSEQNPNYSPYAVDPWGDYQYQGDLRHQKFRPWVNQNPVVNAFDPAAWQLKWIKLPSGGEIHVQYEQNEYSYVQHRQAMVMAPLLRRKASGGADRHAYVLDLNAVGMTSADNAMLVELLRDQFIENGEYIYFKFLYALKGTDPDPDLCTSEYINGYASVTEVGLDNGEVYVRIGDINAEKTIPDKICRDFYTNTRDGILTENCGIPDQTPIGSGSTDEERIGSAVYGLFQSGPDQMAATLVDMQATPYCQEINFEHSFLRIPTTKPKKGGGIRVKRILTYDPGLEEDDIALYGTEYTYKLPDGRSSGVATTEPVAAREENALVHLDIRRLDPENHIDTIVTGKVMSQHELPLGESLLPAASIGYSRVIAHNIHKGKSGPGFSVYEFFTARDYPVDLRNIQISTPDALDLATKNTRIRTDRTEPFPIEILIYGQNSTYLNATQGYRFVLNNMHGQVSTVSKYIGSFNANAPHTENASLTEQVRYDYYQPWEKIPVMYTPELDENEPGFDPGDRKGIDYQYPGKVVEVVTESRKTTDFSGDVNIQLDIGAHLGFLLPLPFGSAQGRYQRDKRMLRTHVTTKVISYPPIVKSVTSTKDGLTDKTEYLAFDPESGNPIVTKSYDGYHGLQPNNLSEPLEGSYYSLGIPAWQSYANFTQIARTQNLVIRSDNIYDPNDGNSGFVLDKRFIRAANGDEHYLTVNALSPSAVKKFFESVVEGDLIQLFIDDETSTAGDLYHIGTISGNRIQLLPVSYSFSNTEHTATGVSLVIVKTARNNRVGASIGGFTTYGKLPLPVVHPAP